MAIRILSAKLFATKLKATIRSSGKLGFSEATAKILDLESGKFAKFAEDTDNGTLYLIIIDKGSKDAFPIRKSSGYFYAPTTRMFDALGYNYSKGLIIFDLIRQCSLDKELQGKVLFMKQRKHEKQTN